jgi:hypothetical protein
MMTIRMLREQFQDSEFYYDRDREVVFKFKDKLLEIRGSTVPEKGPVVIEFRESEDEDHVREHLRLPGVPRQEGCPLHCGQCPLRQAG